VWNPWNVASLVISVHHPIDVIIININDINAIHPPNWYE
jgi:hypothetical protein